MTATVSQLVSLLRAHPPRLLPCRDAIELCAALGIAWQLSCGVEWEETELLVKVGEGGNRPRIGAYRWNGRRWQPLEAAGSRRAEVDEWDYATTLRQHASRYRLDLSRDDRSCSVPVAPAKEALIRAHGLSESVLTERTEAAVDPAEFAVAVLRLVGVGEEPEGASRPDPFRRTEVLERLQSFFLPET